MEVISPPPEASAIAELARIHCTKVEIAGVLHVIRQLWRHCLRVNLLLKTRMEGREVRRGSAGRSSDLRSGVRLWRSFSARTVWANAMARMFAAAVTCPAFNFRSAVRAEGVEVGLTLPGRSG
jgi:hypothetical protein